MQNPFEAGRKEVIFSRWEKVGRRETRKNPFTSGHPETEYSGGKLGFGEGGVSPPGRRVYAGHVF